MPAETAHLDGPLLTLIRRGDSPGRDKSARLLLDGRCSSLAMLAVGTERVLAVGLAIVEGSERALEVGDELDLAGALGAADVMSEDGVGQGAGRRPPAVSAAVKRHASAGSRHPRCPNRARNRQPIHAYSGTAD